MLLVRFLAIGVALVIVISAALFLVTRNRKYLRAAITVGKWAVIAGLLAFGLLIAERLLVII